MIGAPLSGIGGASRLGWLSTCWGLALLVWLAGAGRGAASGNIMVAPDPSSPGLTALGASPLSGLKMQIDSIGPDGYGYRPVKFRFTAPVPPKAALRVRVLFSASSWSGSQSLMTVERSFEYPAGAASHEIVLDVPQHADWQFHFWSVWVNGQLDRSLSLEEKSPFYVGATGNIVEKLLRINPSKTECVPTPAAAKNEAVLSTMRLQNNNPVPHFEDYTGPVPANWLRISAYDAISISIGDLEKLAGSKTGELTTLKRWTAAGGSLLVYGEDTAEERSSIDRLMGASPEPLAAEGNERELVWEQAPLGHFGIHPNPELSRLSQGIPATLGWEKRPGWGTHRNSMTQKFSKRSYRFGSLVVLDEELPPSGLEAMTQSPDIGAVTHPYLPFVQSNGWGKRFGVNPEAGPTVEFSDWLLPGQGAAPVTLFRVMLTVFVVLVGPFNYWILRAWGKQHLLVVTTPILAALFTVALLGYALLADGLATKARVQSLTYLDQPQGEAVSWARMSYYAGIAPRRGLQMPTEAMMIPVRAPGDQTLWGGERGSNRLLIWNDTQQLASGWLPSRTPTQFLQVYPYQTDLRINITAEAQRVTARNALGSPLELLVVADPAGKLWMADGCAADATAQLKQVTRAKAFEALRGELMDREPAFPPGTSSQDFELDAGRQGYARKYGFFASEPNLGFSGNRMAIALSALKGTFGKRVQLAPRSYVAIAETSKLVPLGTQATEAASCHVILGSW